MLKVFDTSITFVCRFVHFLVGIPLLFFYMKQLPHNADKSWEGNHGINNK